ncbi:hypothetical protein HDU91_000878 [Kappamyces sp. JEL0680]|nr:hypothetical protein HDU91_000878 [Kappamyces sp. JEL0680]
MAIPTFPWSAWLADTNQSLAVEESPAPVRMSQAMLELAQEFSQMLRVQEAKHQEQLIGLKSTIGSETQQPSVSAAYEAQTLQLLQRQQSESLKIKQESDQIKEQIKFLDASMEHVEFELAQSTAANEALRSRIADLEGSAGKTSREMQALQAELEDKDRTIRMLQAEIEEQNEYQAMVAKLAESVNRRKPGGMTGVSVSYEAKQIPEAAEKTASPAIERKVPDSTKMASVAEEFSQPFY